MIDLVDEIEKAGNLLDSALAAIVPINSLPSEILARIFHLVSGTDEEPRTCTLSHGIDEFASVPKYPDLLSHVCARWRQVMIASPAFWAHIDLVPMLPQSSRFLARANAYTARAGEMLLGIHFYMSGPYISADDCDTDGILDALTAIAPRARSLNMDAPGGSGKLGELVLQCFFNNCISGNVTELTVVDYQPIIPINSPDRFRIQLNSNSLKNLLLPVTVLRLRGLYLPWSHQVYHGLVELRLTCNHQSTVHIPESDLIGILRSSPRLKILHLNISISNPLPNESSMSAVLLEDLEILNLASMQGDQLGAILRLLAPGVMPLRFSFMHKAKDSLLVKSQIIGFIARLNVTQVYVTGMPYPSYQTLCELFGLVPDLRILALDGSHLDQFVSSPLDPGLAEPLLSRPCSMNVDVLYLTRCHVNWDWLEEMAKYQLAKMTVLWNCTVVEEGLKLSDQDLITRLSGICPALVYADKDPNPIGHWN